MTVDEWAAMIAADLAAGRLGAVRTAFLNFEVLWKSDPRAMLDACAVRPRSTGHDGWDACLAALIDFLCERDGVDPPEWVADVPPASAPLFVWGEDRFREEVVKGTPVQFSRRNVFVARETWDSV